MRVAMVISSFKPIVGGSERQLEGMLPHLSKLGVFSTVITRRVSGTKKNEDFDNYKIKRLPAKVPKIGFGISLAYELIKNRGNYDLIHCHTLNGQAAFLSVCVGALVGLPVILKITRSGPGTQLQSYLRTFLGKGLLKILFYGAKKVVAITRDVENELILTGLTKSKVISIPNGVEKSSDLLKMNTHSVRVVCVGRLIKRKRIDLLIQAFKNLPYSYNCELTIVGDGPCKDDLEKLTKKLLLDEQINFLGQVPKEEINDILLDSEIFVLPSSSEGMSNALLEAMSLGLSVIVADIPANKEIIEDSKNGLTFSDEKALEECLTRLVKDYSYRRDLGSQAKATIETKYSFNQVSRRYRDVYKKLMKI